MKFFIGPVTKNVVDATIAFSNKYNMQMTFIPSRRQIEHDGGYVNNWTTAEFCKYVYSRSSNIEIERDHGGPGQGLYDDDGYASLAEDVKYMSIIHIDPWKKYQSYQDGLESTVNMIKYCYNLNKDVVYEIATEEAIRNFDASELEKLIIDLKSVLLPEVFSKIKYLVIQCGTRLCQNTNIGIFDDKKLKEMISLANKYGMIAKEHNGDWISDATVQQKSALGLQNINIAPEFGEIESKIYIKYFKDYGMFDAFFDICYKSKKWTKWVEPSFVPEENKERLIQICGHYTLAYPEFIELKNKLISQGIMIDNIIQEAILSKLESLCKPQPTVFITTSGTGSRLQELTTYMNKSLILIGNKFTICHIIDKYDIYNTNFVITLGYHGDIVKEFLDIYYVNNTFQYVYVDNYDKAGSSLGYSMLKAKDLLQHPFTFYCCDAIVLDYIDPLVQNNVLHVSSGDGEIYATVQTCSDNITNIHKKGNNNYDYIYTGIAHIHDYSLFWESLQEAYNADPNDSGLSDVYVYISMLNKGSSFKFKALKKWYDTGNLKSLNDTKNIIKSDYDILEKPDESICFTTDNRVIKFFYDKTILMNRVTRGNLLYPNAPRILQKTDHFFSMEYVDGTLLSKVMQRGEIRNLLNWAYENLWTNPITDDRFYDVCMKFYKHKTFERIDKMLGNPNFNEYNTINGIKLMPIKELLEKIDWSQLCTNSFYHFHGDFILDNILKTSDSYKLIDWRQDFGGEITHGDIYYDMAKLRHNIILNHANIKHKLFTVDKHHDGSIVIDLKCNYILMQQLNDFDDFISLKGWNHKKIKILTAIIWLNMAPLYDNELSEFLFYFGKYNLWLELYQESSSSSIFIL